MLSKRDWLMVLLCQLLIDTLSLAKNKNNLQKTCKVKHCYINLRYKYTLLI